MYNHVQPRTCPTQMGPRHPETQLPSTSQQAPASGRPLLLSYSVGSLHSGTLHTDVTAQLGAYTRP